MTQKTLTLFHTGSGAYIVTRGEAIYAARLWRLIPQPIHHLVTKTWSKMRVWTFTFLKTSKTAFSILSYRNIMYLKRKLRTCRIEIQLEKVWFHLEKLYFFRFLRILHQIWFKYHNFFQVQFLKIFENESKKWLYQDLSKVHRNKVMKWQQF